MQVTMDADGVDNYVYLWDADAVLKFEAGIWTQMVWRSVPRMVPDSGVWIIEALAGRKLVPGSRWIVETTTI